MTPLLHSHSLRHGNRHRLAHPAGVRIGLGQRPEQWQRQRHRLSRHAHARPRRTLANTCRSDAAAKLIGPWQCLLRLAQIKVWVRVLCASCRSDRRHCSFHRASRCTFRICVSGGACRRRPSRRRRARAVLGVAARGRNWGGEVCRYLVVCGQAVGVQSTVLVQAQLAVVTSGTGLVRRRTRRSTSRCHHAWHWRTQLHQTRTAHFIICIRVARRWTCF